MVFDILILFLFYRYIYICRYFFIYVKRFVFKVIYRIFVIKDGKLFKCLCLVNFLIVLCFFYTLDYYVVDILMDWYGKIIIILLGRKNMIENNIYGVFLLFVYKERKEGEYVFIFNIIFGRIYLKLWNK